MKVWLRRKWRERTHMAHSANPGPRAMSEILAITEIRNLTPIYRLPELGRFHPSCLIGSGQIGRRGHDIEAGLEVLFLRVSLSGISIEIAAGSPSGRHDDRGNDPHLHSPHWTGSPKPMLPENFAPGKVDRDPLLRTGPRFRHTHPTHACGTAIRGLDEIPIASRMVSCGAIGEDPRLRADAIGIVRGAGR